jgi:hypothetical protein
VPEMCCSHCASSSHSGGLGTISKRRHRIFPISKDTSAAQAGMSSVFSQAVWIIANSKIFEIEGDPGVCALSRNTASTGRGCYSMARFRACRLRAAAVAASIYAQ